jgi:superoxide reductase
MNRRSFIKGALLTAGVLASGNSLAGESAKTKDKELLRLKNKENPSVLEQKHVPGLELPERAAPDEWIDVKVNVGFMKEHPSTPEHWITKIKLLADGNTIAKTSYKTGGVSPSSATFRIRLKKTSTLEAVEHCNLHGTWISDPVTIKVS